MHNLKTVWLRENVCINEDFSDLREISTLSRLVADKCRNPDVETCREELAELKALKENLGSEVARNSAENTKNLIKIAQLEGKLTLAETAKAQAESQVALIKEFANKLDAQRNATFAARNEELLNAIEHKTRVNEELLIEVQKQEAEINEKKEKIKNLQEKLQILNNDMKW